MGLLVAKSIELALLDLTLAKINNSPNIFFLQ